MPALALFALVLLPTSVPTEARWYFAPERAFAEARRAGVPVMLNLYVPSHPLTRWADRALYSDPNVVRSFGSVVPLRMRADREGKELADRHGFGLQPATLFLTPDGTPFWRTTGRMGGTMLVQQIEAARRMMPKVPAYLHALKTGRGSSEELAAAAILAAVSGRDGVAEGLIRKARLQGASTMLERARGILGEEYRLKQRFEPAVKHLAAAAESKDAPTSSRALYNLAFCHMRLGKQSLAMAALKRIDAMQGGSEDPWISKRMMMRLASTPYFAVHRP